MDTKVDYKEGIKIRGIPSFAKPKDSEVKTLTPVSDEPEPELCSEQPNSKHLYKESIDKRKISAKL